MLLMKDRSFLYELRAYLIYVKVEKRSFSYELKAYLIYVKVGEIVIYLCGRVDSTFLRTFFRLDRNSEARIRTSEN